MATKKIPKSAEARKRASFGAASKNEKYEARANAAAAFAKFPKVTTFFAQFEGALGAVAHLDAILERRGSEFAAAGFAMLPNLVFECADGPELIVRLPSDAPADIAAALVSSGLGRSRTKAFLEFRGRGDPEAVRSRVADAGGVVVVLPSFGGATSPADQDRTTQLPPPP